MTPEEAGLQGCCMMWLLEEAGLQGCCMMWLGNLFLTFQRNELPSLAELWVNLQTKNPENEGGMFLRNIRKYLPKQLLQQPRIPASSI